MDQTLLLAMIAAAAVGLAAAVLILRRDRVAAATAGPVDSPFAVSTEGEKRCPSCGMGNLVTDANCVSCGASLPG
ncbi:MAG TPA: hypothetical protein VFS32_15100 [Candidatus Limnocylindrales bacterium]|nr:hypothetical protein [Candidatus Limnocylindrales bacterium]